MLPANATAVFGQPPAGCIAMRYGVSVTGVHAVTAHPSNPGSITRPSGDVLDFTFESCDRASVRWSSTDAAFTAAGSLDLQRLTSVAGSACE